MTRKADRTEREKRQARVSLATWGLLLIVMGGLFTLADLGKIDMGDRWRYPPSNAVDGNPATRWASAFSDPQWIAVDLGAPTEITKVRLSWEQAYATAYRIEVSNDDSHWTTVKEVTSGDGGIDDLEVAASGRYVRMVGTKRATPYGFSLWELEVYGTGGSAVAAATASSEGALSQGKAATASSRETASYWSLYWPLLLIAGGLPALIVPKDGGDQVFGLVLTSAGVFLQLQHLGLIRWTFSQAWPILLMAAGLLLVTQALRQMGKPSDDSRSGGEAGPAAGAP